jgi:hypothetical protein
MRESAAQRVPRRERLRVGPALDRSEVVFLAGFGRVPVRDHDGQHVESRETVARIWPGQPAVACPWVPCADGCCLHVTPTALPGVAAQWLRFLLEEFLEPDHAVSGTVEVSSAAGRIRSLLIVESNEVFEGDLDEGGGA